MYTCICVWYIYVYVWRGACSWPLAWPVNHIYVSHVQWLWSDLGIRRALQVSVPSLLSVQQGALPAALVPGRTAGGVRPAPPGPARPPWAISSRRAAGPQHRTGDPRPSVPPRLSSELSPLA